MFSKLNGISKKIDKNLFQAQRVSTKGNRSSGRNADNQFDISGGGLITKEIGKLIKKLVQLKINPFKGDLARLNLRKIEKVVDDRQQRLC